MNLLTAAIAFLLALMLVLVGVTRIGAWRIERRNPPAGEFADIGGARLHYVHVPAGPNSDLPPLVFIHGASGNLKDQMVPLLPLLEGRAEMLFFDRPGHAWSGRGTGNETPAGQAKTIVALMRHVGIESAIIVGHSFGGAVTASLALDHRQAVRGLVFLSPASHPWPDGRTSWYYRLTGVPVLGRLFSETLAYPGAIMRMKGATDCVFSPNHAPDDYLSRTSIELLLRPRAFRSNGKDVDGLFAYVETAAPRYREIETPTVIISGDRDTVVYEEIHSVGLNRDIPDSQLVWVHNLGHKPDWVASDLVVAAIEKVAGKAVDLEAAVRTVEARIADDAFAVDACPDEKPGLPMPAEQGG